MNDTVIGDDRLKDYGDEFYELLLDAHQGLDEAGSHALNARLVLIMANQIGDRKVLESIVKMARG